MRVQRGHDVAYRQHNKSIKGKKRTSRQDALCLRCVTTTLYHVPQRCYIARNVPSHFLCTCIHVQYETARNVLIHSCGQLQGVNILANLHQGTNDNGNHKDSSRKQC
ncbi:hypothetical protein MAR_005795 [Mya arenaria]|uniref:Uncharacterized protein n=1 Tax=Mya arenaria TaxID=6604 RepID=A0ABY7F0I6_MYAAR|nr:hypothetical protein MAR_005795 [Mya arenaria]